MKPGWVLNEEDRNRRFRKTIEKKRMMAEEAVTSSTAVTRDEGGHSSDPEDYHCPPPPVPHQPMNGRMGLRLQADLARYITRSIQYKEYPKMLQGSGLI